MRIALFGYGKMGKMIEGIAQERGHEIKAKIDIDNLEETDFSEIDMAIDFSVPEAAVANILPPIQVKYSRSGIATIDTLVPSGIAFPSSIARLFSYPEVVV